MDKYSLLQLKHEINNIIFKLKTAVDILSEENLTEEEKKHIISIMRTNINDINLLFENLLLLEKLQSLKKEKIYLKDFFKENVSKRYIYGFPKLLSLSLQNLKEIGIKYRLVEEKDFLILRIEKVPEDRFHTYIFSITEYFLSKNGIKTEVQK